MDPDAPLAEKDDVVVIGKVWRRDEERSRTPGEAPALAPAAARPGPAPARLRRRTDGGSAEGRRLDSPPRPTAAGGPARVPSAAPAPRPRRRDQRGRPAQWPVTAAGPAGPVARRGGGHGPRLRSPTTSGRPRTARRRAGGPPCRAARVPGRCAGNGRQERGRHITRPGRTEDAPAARRLPHHGQSRTRTPPPRCERDDAGRASLDSAGSAQPQSFPPAHGDQGTPAGPVGPVAPGGAHPVPAMGDPVPAAGDPVPAAGDPVPAAGDPVPADQNSR